MQEMGILGTAAPRTADITLLLELGMGAGLLAGALLARAKRFRLHAACQSIIVLLNLVLIILAMFPSFSSKVSPNLPAKMGKSYYALTVTHAASGGIAELGGLYILLAAGTSLLPGRLRITRYRFWMRSLLVLWWVVLLLGLVTYSRWYLPHTFRK